MTKSRPRAARILAVVLLVMVAMEALGLVYLKALPFSRITVLSYEKEADLYWHPTPGRRSTVTDSHGVTQVIVGPRYSLLRQYRAAVQNDCGIDLDGARTDLERAVIVRQWVRRQYEFDTGSKVQMFDYRGLLRHRLSDRGLCDAFATLFVGAAISLGLPARLVHLNTGAGIGSRGHYTTEVYLPDQRRWVVMDPLHDCHYTAEGRLLSALDLHRLARQAQAMVAARVQRAGRHRRPVALALDDYYRHIQIVSRTDFDTHRLRLFGGKLLFLNWTGDGASALGRQEAVLRLVLLFIWPGAGLAATAVLILVGRPRTSLLLLVGKKPIRPEFRE